MNLLIIGILLLLGLILIILEILVIPGGIVGIVGAGLMVWAIVDIYIEYGILYGNLALISVIVLSILAIYMSMRSKTWRKLTLTNTIDGKSDINLEASDLLKEGMIGKTITRLNPMGKAEFDDKYYEVTSMEGFIEHEKTIIIHRIKENKIIVKLVN